MMDIDHPGMSLLFQTHRSGKGFGRAVVRDLLLVQPLDQCFVSCIRSTNTQRNETHPDKRQDHEGEARQI